MNSGLCREAQSIVELVVFKQPEQKVQFNRGRLFTLSRYFLRIDIFSFADKLQLHFFAAEQPFGKRPCITAAHPHEMVRLLRIQKPAAAFAAAVFKP